MFLGQTLVIILGGWALKTLSECGIGRKEAYSTLREVTAQGQGLLPAVVLVSAFLNCKEPLESPGRKGRSASQVITVAFDCKYQLIPEESHCYFGRKRAGLYARGAVYSISCVAPTGTDGQGTLSPS